MPVIKSKREFYARSSRLLCGNTPRVWEDIDSFKRDADKVVTVGIRRTLSWDAQSYYCLSPNEAIAIASTLPVGSFLISENSHWVDQITRIGFQGELSWINGSWCLYYTLATGYMRDKLKESGAHIFGWDAERLLKQKLNESDVDMLFDLFNYYTEGCDYPVIEFAKYCRSWGCLNRSLIIWEIRNGY